MAEGPRGEPISHPQTDFNQHKHHWDFNERADDGRECLAGVNTKDRNGNSNSQFKIVARSR